MSDESRIEEVVSAHRARDPRGQLQPLAAFYDLEPADRQRAYHQGLLQRTLESALAPDGLSSTAHAVLARIHAERA